MWNAWQWVKRQIRENRGKVTAALVTALAWGSRALGVPIPEPVLEWGTATILVALVGAASGEVAARRKVDALDSAIRRLQEVADDTERRMTDIRSK